MIQKFNPLTDTVVVKSHQSFDLAPDLEPAKELDTTTSAIANQEPRRFDLNDLPYYADRLYPRLKNLFPHINDRMYGGWIRGCINDNACLFLCTDVKEGQGGVCGMAFVRHDPLDPVPYVQILFVIGEDAVRLAMYERIAKWGRDMGAKEVRYSTIDDTFKEVKGGVEESVNYVLVLGA